MTELKRLVKKSIETIREYGWNIFFQKTKYYLQARKQKRKMRKRMNGASNERDYIFADVLFINGCYLPHPSRYRVSHQREQMLANGMMSQEVFYTELELKYVKRYRAFIFYRCPYTDMIGQFIRKARSFNKVCIFDIDDLVIDTKYTDNIPFLATLNPDEKEQYDRGVNLMQKTLKLCDAAITTTEALADELRHYVPEVFINRNTASDAMAQRSAWAVYNRDVLPYLSDNQITDKSQLETKRKMLAEQKKNKDIIKVGYFSGSITHNDDIDMILPVLKKVMAKDPNVYLCFAGELDIPEELSQYKDRIRAFDFCEWQELPNRIAQVDINIAPLCDTLFNAAKSENKWVEAALVKVPTIASCVGAMEKMIDNMNTGILCSDEKEWLAAFDRLISDEAFRKKLAENAYDYVIENCLTISTGIPLCEYIRRKIHTNIAFVLPSLGISGGILVVLKHCVELKKLGYDVLVINDNVGSDNITKGSEEINVLSTRTDMFMGQIDYAVGTLWTTMDWVSSYKNILHKEYLVQGYETGFYDRGNFWQFSANQTYSLNSVRYITVSKWCLNWLKNKYHKQSRFIPNGLDRENFKGKQRDFSGRKIRILIEGNCADRIKNVDESFRIAEKLDKDKFEIWFLSSLGEPKSWYYIDKFLHKVPYEQVVQVYSQCDILIKSSILESFSYPPLEMMATGGYVVVRPNDGNVEYLRDGENCLMYDGSDLQTAVDAIEKIASDPALRDRLYEGGQKTADERDWKNYVSDIVNAYI